MSDSETIIGIADQAYKELGNNTGVENYIWDKVKRIVANARTISKMPEIAESNINADSLRTAAYFCETGILGKDRDKGYHLNSKNNSFDYLSVSVDIAQEKLKSKLDSAKLKKVCLIIKECGNNISNVPEAMILSDARNLEDMGAIGLFNQFRTNAFANKSVSDVLKSWKRKLDYMYWEARLQEGFHFESVKKLANERLQQAQYFMDQLKRENTRADIAEFIEDTVR